VNAFDTAAMYGESEAVLGRAFAKLGISEQVIVATKVRHLTEEFASMKDAEAAIEASVDHSRRLLRMDCLPLVLFHREEDFRYIDTLLRLRERGWIRHVGASVMTPEATRHIIASGLADAVQLPTHLLDNRFTGADLFEDAHHRGVALFVRSVYFQGLLLMPEERVPAHLAEVLPIRRALQVLAAEAGIGLDALAVRYVLGLPGLTSLLLGVETVEQMRANLALMAQGPLEPALMQAVQAAVPSLPDDLLMPNLWAQRVKS
jgi:aryl-alcohol dehydrogenase-like predicted oxidoreductase